MEGGKLLPEVLAEGNGLPRRCLWQLLAMTVFLSEVL